MSFVRAHLAAGRTFSGFVWNLWQEVAHWYFHAGPVGAQRCSKLDDGDDDKDDDGPTPVACPALTAASFINLHRRYRCTAHRSASHLLLLDGNRAYTARRLHVCVCVRQMLMCYR